MSAGFSLPCGRWVLLDPSDMKFASAHRWYASRSAQRAERHYVAAHANGTTIYLHRLILQAPKGIQVDHANGDGLDNRRSNIRIASCSQNNANREAFNQTSFRGVFRCPGNRFRAMISERRGNTKQRHLGYFGSAEEAARAYDAAALIRFGEFARLNFTHEAAP